MNHTRSRNSFKGSMLLWPNVWDTRFDPSSVTIINVPRPERVFCSNSLTERSSASFNSFGGFFSLGEFLISSLS